MNPIPPCPWIAFSQANTAVSPANAFAARHARAVGAQALRLEVSHENARARAAYIGAGFVAETRDLMTLRLV